MTRLEFGDSQATRFDLAVYDSLVIRQVGQRSDKTRWPNGRFMKGRFMLCGPVYEEIIRNILLQRKQDYDSL